MECTDTVDLTLIEGKSQQNYSPKHMSFKEETGKMEASQPCIKKGLFPNWPFGIELKKFTNLEFDC